MTVGLGRGTDTDGSGPRGDFDITSDTFENGVKLPADYSCLFFSCTSLSFVDFSGSDTSSVKSMSYMLARCFSIVSRDLLLLNSTSVTDMSNMFDMSFASFFAIHGFIVLLGSFRVGNLLRIREVRYDCDGRAERRIRESPCQRPSTFA